MQIILFTKHIFFCLYEFFKCDGWVEKNPHLESFFEYNDIIFSNSSEQLNIIILCREAYLTRA